jgi:hypothetical protein
MACEAPTLLGDLPVYRELAAEGEGVRYVALDANSIASALNALTPEEGRTVGAAGRKRILGVADINAEARRVSDLYRRLIAAPRRRRTPSIAEAWSLLPRSL